MVPLQNPGCPTPHYFVCCHGGPVNFSPAPLAPRGQAGGAGARDRARRVQPGSPAGLGSRSGRRPGVGGKEIWGEPGGGRGAQPQPAEDRGRWSGTPRPACRVSRRPGVKGQVPSPPSDSAAKALPLPSQSGAPSHPTPPQPRSPESCTFLELTGGSPFVGDPGLAGAELRPPGAGSLPPRLPPAPDEGPPPRPPTAPPRFKRLPRGEWRRGDQCAPAPAARRAVSWRVSAPFPTRAPSAASGALGPQFPPPPPCPGGAPPAPACGS